MRSGSSCVKHMVGGVCGSMPLVDGDGCGEDVVWREDVSAWGGISE